MAFRNTDDRLFVPVILAFIRRPKVIGTLTKPRHDQIQTGKSCPHSVGFRRHHQPRAFPNREILNNIIQQIIRNCAKLPSHGVFEHQGWNT